MGCEVGEGGAETGNVTKVENQCPGDVTDVGFEGEGGIKDDAKVTDCSGASDCVSLEEEGDILGRE